LDHFYNAFTDVQRQHVQVSVIGLALSAVPPIIIETAFVLAALGVSLLVAWEPGARENVLPVLGLFAYAGFRLVPTANRVTAVVRCVGF